MQYTIRNIPSEVDHQLRDRAREKNLSINAVVIELLADALEVGEKPRRDLSDIAGTWSEDPAVDAELKAQRKIDAQLW